MTDTRPIIIQGAMEVEIEYFKGKLSNLEEVNLYGYEFYKGEYENYPVIISKTNVGLVEVAIATFIGITKFNPIAIINGGTAGACTNKLHNKDIIIGNESININSFITSTKKENEGISPFEWELLTFKEGKDELVKFVSDKKLLDIALKIGKRYKNVKTGTIGSGDVWDKEIDRIKWFNNKYNISCEDMETVSVYNICNKLNVPVLGIRVISDNEITGEEYDRKVAIEWQKYALEICKELKESTF